MIKERTNCDTCKNVNCFIKTHLDKDGVSDYIEKKHTIYCNKSQQFILEGAPVHGLFFVYQGKVKVTKTGIYGRQQIVRFAKDGEIIGHRGFGVGNYYPISATAIENTVLCNFTTDTLTDMLHKIPALTFDLMLFYSEELNKSETKVRKFAQMTVREKVIDAFLYILRKFGETNGFLDVSLSRKEIADFAGTTEEQVIRVISSLKKDGLMKASGKKLGILHVEKLKTEISEHNYFLDS